MKKLSNIFSLLLVVCASLAFTACGSDDIDYTPGAASDGVYFPSSNSSEIRLSKEESSFDVTIMRTHTVGSQTANLVAEGTEGLYTVPSSVTFADGSDTETLTITYDPEAVEYDDFKEITISIADEASTPYGVSSYTFTAGIPSPWTSLGMCSYREDFVTTFFGVENVVYEVELQENDLQPGYYRLVNPYGAAYPYNAEGDWDTSQDYYLEIHAEDPTAVYIDVQTTGMDWGYGAFRLGSMAGYYLAKGTYTLEELKAQGLTGTMENGIITFPDNSLLCGMTDYNNGGLYPANGAGAFYVALPGVVVADYSLTVAYGGKYTNSLDVDEGVLAALSEIGADVSKIRLAVVAGNDIEAAVEGIRSGNIDYVEVDPTEGSHMIPFGTEPVEGSYMLVAISYDANGVAQDVSYVSFKYVPAGVEETWTLVSTGDYTYTLFFGSEDEPAVDEGLSLYVSDSDASRFKIEHWGYDVDFTFTMDQTTGEIMVDDQETGYTHNTYGMVYVDDIVDYTGNTNKGYSFYEDGVFYFAVVYYVSEGAFGYGYETFVLSDAASAASTRAISRPNDKVKAPHWSTPKFMRRLNDRSQLKAFN